MDEALVSDVRVALQYLAEHVETPVGWQRTVQLDGSGEVRVAELGEDVGGRVVENNVETAEHVGVRHFLSDFHLRPEQLSEVGLLDICVSDDLDSHPLLVEGVPSRVDPAEGALAQEVKKVDGVVSYDEASRLRRAPEVEELGLVASGKTLLREEAVKYVYSHNNFKALIIVDFHNLKITYVIQCIRYLDSICRLEGDSSA